MTPKSLKKLKRELEQMRRSPQNRTSADLLAYAKKLGRTKDNRGKEPTYVREKDPALSPPLSIPGHATELKVGTAISVIDALLDDVDEWEMYFNEENDDDDDDDDKGTE